MLMCMTAAFCAETSALRTRGRGACKIGTYMSGALLPVLDETKLFEDQPEYVLLPSWHIGMSWL